jgi:hypothetical protein
LAYLSAGVLNTRQTVCSSVHKCLKVSVLYSIVDLNNGANENQTHVHDLDSVVQYSKHLLIPTPVQTCRSLRQAAPLFN